MTACPNSTESGCRCEQHHLGLLAYSPNPDALEASLVKLRPVLRVVTMPVESEPVCEGTYTCSCPACVAERVRLMQQAQAKAA